MQVNALTPSLDATSLEIFEVLVRGSGQLLISNVKKCEPVKVGESASQSEEIIEIDDFDNSAVSGAADQRDSDHADAEDVVQVHSDSDSSAESDTALQRSALRPKRAAAPTKRYAPVEVLHCSKKQSVLYHYDECFLCNDGGDLVTCDVCPHVYHLDCVGLEDLPKGMWRCPWHSCSECDKSSSKAEGVLFHCMTCPLTYCFECAPDEYTAVSPQWSSAAALKIASLNGRGMSCPKSYRFFQCSECVTDERELKMPKPKPERKQPKFKPDPVTPTPYSTKAESKNAAVAKPYVLPGHEKGHEKHIHSKASRVVVQSEHWSTQVAQLQERIKFFQQLIEQSQGCRLQLSGRLSLCPPGSDKAQAIALQIQQLQNGEVFHSHVTLQTQQQLQELMNSSAQRDSFSSPNAGAAISSSDIGASYRAALPTPSDAHSAVESAFHTPSLHDIAELGKNSDRNQEQAEFEAALSLSLENGGVSSASGGDRQATIDHQSDGDVSSMPLASTQYRDAPRHVAKSAKVDSGCKVHVPDIHSPAATDVPACNSAAAVHAEHFSTPLMRSSPTAVPSSHHLSIINSVSPPLDGSIITAVAQSSPRLAYSPSQANFTDADGIMVPSNRQYVSWNEFQQINKGANRERVSQAYRATPWFKAALTQTEVRLPAALTHTRTSFISTIQPAVSSVKSS